MLLAVSVAGVFAGESLVARVASERAEVCASGQEREAATCVPVRVRVQHSFVGEAAPAKVALIFDGVQSIGVSSPCLARWELLQLITRGRLSANLLAVIAVQFFIRSKLQFSIYVITISTKRLFCRIPRHCLCAL